MGDILQSGSMAPPLIRDLSPDEVGTRGPMHSSLSSSHGYLPTKPNLIPQDVMMHLGPKVMRETRVSMSVVSVRSCCWSCYDSHWTRGGRGQARTESFRTPGSFRSNARRVTMVVARLPIEQAESHQAILGRPRKWIWNKELMDIAKKTKITKILSLLNACLHWNTAKFMFLMTQSDKKS